MGRPCALASAAHRRDLDTARLPRASRPAESLAGSDRGAAPRGLSHSASDDGDEADAVGGDGVHARLQLLPPRHVLVCGPSAAVGLVRSLLSAWWAAGRCDRVRVVLLLRRAAAALA